MKNKPKNSVLAQKHLKAFTLIELLVVVSIIALLVSIIIPAMTRARNEARKVVCASQMHQISLAFNSYSLEYNDWILTAKEINETDPQTGQKAWNFELMPYIGQESSEYSLKNKASLWYCPEDKDPYPVGFGSYSHENEGFTSYALNGYYSQARPPRGLRPGTPEAKLGPAGKYRTTQIKHPAACMLMVETSYSGLIYDADHPKAQQCGLTTLDRPHHRRTSGFYHKHTMNTIYVDSHVGNIKGLPCETVSMVGMDNGYKTGKYMFWPELTLPNALQQPGLWGPGYYDK